MFLTLSHIAVRCKVMYHTKWNTEEGHISIYLAWQFSNGEAGIVVVTSGWHVFNSVFSFVGAKC